MRVEIAQQRQHNVANIRWWVAQHLRSSVRRREIVRARLQDTLRRLEWVGVEFALVQRIDAQAAVRLEVYRPQLGMGMASEWLQRLRGHCAAHLASLDALQVRPPSLPRLLLPPSPSFSLLLPPSPPFAPRPSPWRLFSSFTFPLTSHILPHPPFPPQETVILEESGRLARDEGQALEFDSLMQELYQVRGRGQRAEESPLCPL